MTAAIGIVMTGHIVAGRLEDQRLVGELLRYPSDTGDLDSLSAVPGRELVAMLAEQVATLVGSGRQAVDAIGLADPGIIRNGVV